MGILRERKTWKAPRDPRATRRSSDLTPEEQANAKAALRFLVRRYGSIPKLAEALAANHETVKVAMGKRGRPSAGLALRTARLAGAHLEDVLAGRWPLPGACPMCGRP